MDAQEQRRLLELAAKAAGIGPVLCYESARNCLRIGNRESYTLWRPLTDDGDNRRLQVALELELRVFNGKAHAGKQDQFWITEDWFPDGDPNTASRLAVLRAAAVLGENMP